MMMNTIGPNSYDPRNKKDKIHKILFRLRERHLEEKREKFLSRTCGLASITWSPLVAGRPHCRFMIFPIFRLV